MRRAGNGEGVEEELLFCWFTPQMSAARTGRDRATMVSLMGGPSPRAVGVGRGGRAAQAARKKGHLPRINTRETSTM